VRAAFANWNSSCSRCSWVRGGSDQRLQNAGLLEVLPLLAGAKLLSKPAVAELHDAYLALRKAENASADDPR